MNLAPARKSIVTRRAERRTLLTAAEEILRCRNYAALNLDGLATSTAMEQVEVAFHFPTKEALLTALIRRRIKLVRIDLRDISDAYHDAESRLVAYACMISDGFERGMQTLLESMAAISSEAPGNVRLEIRKLSHLQLDWVKDVVQEHRATCSVQAPLPATAAARLIVSALEGDTLIDRALGKSEPSAASFIEILALLGISQNKPIHA
jgi:TetR/AcrR family transcriptional regulator, transcriptional repressor for nem operon